MKGRHDGGLGGGWLGQQGQACAAGRPVTPTAWRRGVLEALLVIGVLGLLGPVGTTVTPAAATSHIVLLTAASPSQIVPGEVSTVSASAPST